MDMMCRSRAMGQDEPVLKARRKSVTLSRGEQEKAGNINVWLKSAQHVKPPQLRLCGSRQNPDGASERRRSSSSSPSSSSSSRLFLAGVTERHKTFLRILSAPLKAFGQWFVIFRRLECDQEFSER
ncbi:hypothetical protein Q8A67_002866 [Cirrhinus molitorella]|uniref:Uncharacterized protein n=1 Tax=Cirrhinus molitorella TaxID=172907 RepID=A0AA88TWF3_9TELE|nr:hypothetical protein Q8A67_002866 [Cirrhinus molitorella]